MKARIARTIVGVTALIIVALGVPLAIVIQRFYESRATVELQRSAAEAIAELTVPLDAAEIADAAAEPDSPPDFSVYDATGTRLYGTGPEHLESTDPEQLAVVSPITDRATETVVGSVRVSRPRSDVAAEARRAWAVMGLAALVALAAAMLIARREASAARRPDRRPRGPGRTHRLGRALRRRAADRHPGTRHPRKGPRLVGTPTRRAHRPRA